MEHPGLDINQIKEDFTIEQLQVKIKELSTRLSFAYQTQNQPLVNQLEMVYETYNRAYIETLNEMFGNDGGDDMNEDKIDIS